MKCSCCGQEITRNDRFCPNCGENNESYVEVTEKSKSSPSKITNQPIKKAPINISSSNSSTPANNSRQNNQAKQIVIYFSIASGSYGATFNVANSYEMSTLSKYNVNKKTTLISGLILLCTTLSFVVPIIMLFSGSELIRFSNFTYFIIDGIIGLITLIVFAVANNNLNNIKYDYILYDLKKKGVKITYVNKSTGTISYSKNGSRNQISVYRGYNSHANSRYWK